MTTIRQKQAIIDIDVTGAIPDAYPDTAAGDLIGHLTQGFSAGTFTGPAVTVTGSVPVEGGDKMDVGFIQTLRVSTYQAFYTGRVASEGAIALMIEQKMPGGDQVDIGPGSTAPWFSPPSFGVGAGGRRSALLEDHPGMKTYLSLKNKVRSYVPNYLMHVIFQRDFTTTLAAQENGTLTLIASRQWTLLYEFKLKWPGGKPMVTTNGSRLTTRPTVIGDPGIDRAALTGKSANDINLVAKLDALTSGPPVRVDKPSGFITAPFDFWT